MDKKIKARWVEALRKGEVNGKPIVQAKNALRVDVDAEGRIGFCCLGVLCELARADGVTSFYKSEYNNAVRYWYGGHFEVLPDEVVNWAGLPDVNPNVEFESAGTSFNSISLAQLNDDENKSFEYIADMIEKQL